LFAVKSSAGEWSVMMEREFSAGDVESLVHYEMLSKRASGFLALFLAKSAPREVPPEWLNAMRPAVFSRGVSAIRFGMIGLLLGMCFPPLAQLSSLCLAAVTCGLVLFLAGQVLKRWQRNLLSDCVLCSGQIIDRIPVGPGEGWFHILKIGFRHGEETCVRRVVVSGEIVRFFRMDKLKYGTPVHLLYSPSRPRTILLPVVVFYRTGVRS